MAIELELMSQDARRSCRKLSSLDCPTIPIQPGRSERRGLVEIRRNQHALRAVSLRTPTPVLLPLLRACSFRLLNDASAWHFRWDLARSLRYFLRPPGPLPPESLRLPSPTPNRSDTTSQEIGG